MAAFIKNRKELLLEFFLEDDIKEPLNLLTCNTPYAERPVISKTAKPSGQFLTYIVN